MRKTRVVGAIILALGCMESITYSPLAQESGPNAATGFSMSFEFRGRSYSFELNLNGLSGVPRWEKPEAGNPPLGIEKAIGVSRRQLARYQPTISKWQLAGIGLSPVGTTSKWYYTISWHPDGGNIKDVFVVPVLMDGRPVDLEVRDASSS